MNIATAPKPFAPCCFFLISMSRALLPSISSVAIHRMSPVRPAASVRTRCLCSGSAAAARVPAITASRTAASAAIGAWMTNTAAGPLGPLARYTSAIRRGHSGWPNT